MKPYLNDVMFVLSHCWKVYINCLFSTRPVKRKSPGVRKPAVAASKRKRQESSTEGLSINLMCLLVVLLLVVIWFALILAPLKGQLLHVLLPSNISWLPRTRGTRKQPSREENICKERMSFLACVFLYRTRACYPGILRSKNRTWIGRLYSLCAMYLAWLGWGLRYSLRSRRRILFRTKGPISRARAHERIEKERRLLSSSRVPLARSITTNQKQTGACHAGKLRCE